MLVGEPGRADSPFDQRIDAAPILAPRHQPANGRPQPVERGCELSATEAAQQSEDMAGEPCGAPRHGSPVQERAQSHNANARFPVAVR
jgi:hypothetical protein